MTGKKTFDINKPLLKTINRSSEFNAKYVKAQLGESADIIVRELALGKKQNINICIVYTEGLTDNFAVQDLLIKTLLFEIEKVDTLSKDNTFDALLNCSLPNGDVSTKKNYEDVFLSFLSGDTVVFVDGYQKVISFGTRGWSDRGISEPQTEAVIKGPKDAFTETMRTNTALIRRRIRDHKLWFESFNIGSRTKTDISVAYIKDIVNQEVLVELRERLSKIDIDGILEASYIEDLIEEKKHSVFPTVYSTERPDVVTSHILEGKVAIFVDGTPFVMIVPALFFSFFQSPEDYYQKFQIASLTRILRIAAFFIALLVPSLYIAITTFHPQIIPASLLTNIISQREGIPFPGFMEALIMEITFEILREAGIRMPRAVGAAISVVGALVIGDAAVSAGFVSPIMVIVVAITAIASLLLPKYNLANSVRILRFFIMIMAAMYGLIGISFALMMLIFHLVNLKSFNIPYLSGLAPFSASDQEDLIFRMPTYFFRHRPDYIGVKNKIRQKKRKSDK